MRRVNIYGVLAIAALMVAVGATAAAPPDRTGWAQITVMGGRSAEGAYTVALDFQPNATKSAAAVLVYAEPSHTLLLAHFNGSAQPALLGTERALAITEGVFGSSASRVIVPPDPKGDERIEVQVLYGSERFTAASAKVNVESFSFVTSFQPDNKQFYHCVTCDPCGRMCPECDGPQFTANCVSCTISCGC